MNPAAILAELRAERARLDTAIAALEPLAGVPATANGTKPAAHRKAKAAEGRTYPATRLSGDAAEAAHDKALALAKGGKTLQEIATALGMKYSTVWNWAQKPDWPKA